MKHVQNRMARPVNRAPEAPAPAVPAPVAPEIETAPAEEPRKPPCPYCGSRKSSVNGTKGAYRTRHCEGCGRAFATVEQVKK